MQIIANEINSEGKLNLGELSIHALLLEILNTKMTRFVRLFITTDDSNRGLLEFTT